jgi:hypothetical protein
MLWLFVHPFYLVWLVDEKFSQIGYEFVNETAYRVMGIDLMMVFQLTQCLT